MLSNDVIHTEFDALMASARYKWGELQVTTLTEPVYSYFGLFCDMVREEEKREPLGNLPWWIGNAVVTFRRWHCAELELDRMRQAFNNLPTGEA